MAVTALSRGWRRRRGAPAAAGAARRHQVLESAVLGGVPQQGADQCHEEGGADTLVADVGDDDGEAASPGEFEDVVEVPGDLAGGPEADVDLPSVRDGQRLGQEARLDLPTDLQLLLVSHEFRARVGFPQGSAESGALGAAVQPGPDQGRQERRYEVVVTEPHVFLQLGEPGHRPDDHDGGAARRRSLRTAARTAPVGLGRGEQHVGDGQRLLAVVQQLRQRARDGFRVHQP